MRTPSSCGLLRWQVRDIADVVLDVSDAVKAQAATSERMTKMMGKMIDLQKQL